MTTSMQGHEANTACRDPIRLDRELHDIRTRTHIQLLQVRCCHLCKDSSATAAHMQQHSMRMQRMLLPAQAWSLALYKHTGFGTPVQNAHGVLKGTHLFTSTLHRVSQLWPQRQRWRHANPGPHRKQAALHIRPCRQQREQPRLLAGGCQQTARQCGVKSLGVVHQVHAYLPSPSHLAAKLYKGGRLYATVQSLVPCHAASASTVSSHIQLCTPLPASGKP